MSVSQVQNTKKAIIVLVVFSPLVLFALSSWENRSPFEEINFLEVHPGAGDRNVVFTPVLKNDHSVVVGDSVGADFGAVHYRDCDGDGINEAVIETDKSDWSAEYRESVRHVYKYRTDASGKAQVKLISTELLPEKDPEWIRGKRFCEP